ncbi:hypothetical protein [Falsiroseomonas selenitidurans]|uniref:Uncharacterized protein n=1 Tax=Falsiroseomonas selenitidurans TaxID=2716335 RepID=A0ABX1E8E7_9PROT|nr:hypothetical protein [Falsiroseomonas selenitidurans]NKC33073.1 hypothetical protein [Falsiroseomonas selenitidurans]
MRTLFLHVGMHKTGTSAIQATLHAQRQRLPRFGFAYFPLTANHSRAIRSMVSDNPHLDLGNRLAGLHDPEDARAYGEACRQALLAFIAEAPAPGLLVSGEDIGMLEDEEVDRLLALLRPLVDRIVVLGMVRDPRSYIVSATQQVIKAGRTLAELAGPAMRRPAYRRRFARFEAHPAVDEVRLQRYHPGHLVRGCSVATFLSMCGAPPGLYDALNVRRHNVAVSDTALRMLLAANEAVPVLRPDGRANPGRARTLQQLLGSLPGPAFAPPEALVDLAMAAAAEDIAWMEQRLGIRFEAAAAPATGEAGATTLRRFEWEDAMALIALLNDRLVAMETQGPGAARRQPSMEKPDR